MFEKLQLIREKLSDHGTESVFLGITIIIFFLSLILFVFSKTAVSTQKSIIIQKSKSVGQRIMVDIGGAVEKPGVYAIETGQRVFELVEKAGGLTDQADLLFFDKNINRAQKLNDQVKIYIPFRSSEFFSQTNENTSTSLISINSSKIEDLESLPGVGEITAKKIVDNRPYGSLQDLLDKKVVKSNVYEEIKNLITL